jgi:hypothetical protein
VGGNNSRGG